MWKSQSELVNQAAGCLCSGGRGGPGGVEGAAGVHRGAGSLHLPGHETGGGGVPLQPGLHLCQSLQQHHRHALQCFKVHVVLRVQNLLK